MILKISVVCAFVAKCRQKLLNFVPLELNPYGNNSTKFIIQRR